MLCRKVLNTLEENNEPYVTAYIANPVLSPKGLFLAFAEELGIDADADTGHHSLLKNITRKLMSLSAEGKQVVLFIDEAHAMPEKTLEALRLLTNLETEKVKLFQVVLFAQPELDEQLKKQSLRQLQQRITFSYRLESLGREGVERYVTHRMATAGYNGPAVFSKRALDYLFTCTKGIPRLVNILCHKAMMSAYGKGDRSIELEHVRRAAEDTEGVIEPSVSYRPMMAASIGVIAGAALLFYIASYYL
jgi:MSHA biogenesis protein MshM